MTPELRALANTQYGLVTRVQALEAGYTERRLKTLLQPRGAWIAVRRGVYAERGEWDGADDARRHLLRVVAATMTMRMPYVLSHSSAAVVHGLDCRPFWCELVHVSHPGVLGGRTEGGVKHHPAWVPQHQIVRVGGLAVTSLERTAVDIAREHGFEDGVVACDQVLRRGGQRSAMQGVLTQMWSWPYVTQARTAVWLADAGAENIGESLARMLVVELGFGTPQTQVWVEDDGRRARVDLMLNGHVFEFDGRRKYVGTARGGLAEDAERVLWEEKQREDWLRSLGYGVSRIVWADLFGPGRRAALRRLTREYLATMSRRLARPAS
jgi:hypothetical protein